jgi:hypothetical protein
MVTIYNNTLSERASRVFQYYSKGGFVDFRQSHHFLPVTSERIFHLHASPVLNDCLYRNMHRFEKLVVVDLDEVIMPQHVYSLAEMLQQVEEQEGVKQPHPARGYSFRNNYMFLDLPPDESEVLAMLKYRLEVQPSPKGYSTKSIIDPQACTHMHNHYCWAHTKLHRYEFVIQWLRALVQIARGLVFDSPRASFSSSTANVGARGLVGKGVGPESERSGVPQQVISKTLGHVSHPPLLLSELVARLVKSLVQKARGLRFDSRLHGHE